MRARAGTGELRISHYRADEELKRDALGYFFRATDEQLDRTVVLRVVRASLIRHDAELTAMRNRIRLNAKAAARISHPNLVTIYEFRSLAETDLVVMEHVAGDTLEDMRRGGRRWTVLDIARVIARLADAVGAAHESGLVHGNVTTSNVRVLPDGRVKLLDLGVPKLEILDDHVPHEPADDVRGLARIAFDVLMPPSPDDPPGTARRDPLADPAIGRAHFGFLAPILAKALRSAEGFATAPELRDAILQAIDGATGRSAGAIDFEGGFATHLAGPTRPSREDELPADLQTLAPLSRGGGGKRVGPRLLLPPDLAERMPDLDRETLAASRLPSRAKRQWARVAERLTPGVVIAILLVVALALAARFALRRPSPEGRSVAAATVPEETTAAPEPAPPPDAGGDPVAVADTGQDGGGTAPPPVEAGDGPTTFEAQVRAQPAGTVIRSLETGQTWRDATSMSVIAGDSIRLEFARPGYISQRQVFNGRRLAVTLAPDSVVARFEANIAADVFLVGSGGEQRLGTTNFAAPLPSGTHRFVFRSAGQPDWDTVAAMPRAGQSYGITKQDYGILGSFLATVATTWARISVDGGPARESPVRFDSLSVGRHVVTVSREGYQTIVDTVLVQPGQLARRQYTLRR